ncbi:MAG: hypothetical protein IJV94_01940 [Bacilli bacterium]|nr:hypothetical protein [Bacilli bacterium]
MQFIPQKYIGCCGITVINFILKNYKNQSFSTKIYTKNIPLSTISGLLSSNLVENKLKYCEKRCAYEPAVLPQIIHCKNLLVSHYIVLIKEIGDYYLVYNPSLFNFRYVNKHKVLTKFSGYFIEIYNVKSLNLKNRAYIPYAIRLFFMFLCIDLLIILLLVFLFY